MPGSCPIEPDVPLDRLLLASSEHLLQLDTLSRYHRHVAMTTQGTPSRVFGQHDAGHVRAADRNVQDGPDRRELPRITPTG